MGNETGHHLAEYRPLPNIFLGARLHFSSPIGISRSPTIRMEARHDRGHAPPDFVGELDIALAPIGGPERVLMIVGCSQIAAAEPDDGGGGTRWASCRRSLRPIS
jgi:hypothetical protein